MKKLLVVVILTPIIISSLYGILPLIKNKPFLNEKLNFGNLCFNIHSIPISEIIYPQEYENTVVYREDIKEIIRNIPEDSSIVSSLHIFPHTTNHNISTYMHDKFFLKKNNCVYEEHILYDFFDKNLVSSKNLETFIDYFEKNGFSLEHRKESIIYLKRNPENHKCVSIKPLFI